MKAIGQDGHGDADVLDYREVDMPGVGDRMSSSASMQQGSTPASGT